MAKQQKVRIRIPAEYSKNERVAIAEEVLAHIRKRTAKGKDKDGNQFPRYSKEYTASLDFKNAGKSPGQVNLRLSGDMLAAMEELNNRKGSVTIGFEGGTGENARAEGNIRGTYGKQRGNSAQARDFLGLTEEALQQILDKFPLDDDEERKERTEAVLAARGR